MTIAIVAIGLLLFFLLLTYNRLIRLVNNSKEGWSGIDVQLKRRADLVPNLVTTVKGYAKHEQQLLEEITALRGKAGINQSIPETAKTAADLGQSLKKLMVVAEAYPDLKADKNFLKLQQQLSEIEDSLQKSRRYYNGTVRELNIKIESFPSNIVAKAFGFDKREFFAISEEADKMLPEINFK
jgi:LemA protein